jgi:two-component system response regulator YesN
VLVAEDEPLIRAHIVRKLGENCHGFKAVGEAADGREALEAIADLSPDVKVLIVSGYDEFSCAKSALAFGVKDYLLKPVVAEELRAVMPRLAVQLDAEEERLDREYPAFPETSPRGST